MQAAILALAPGVTDATNWENYPTTLLAHDQRGGTYFFFYIVCAILILVLYMGYGQLAIRQNNRYLRRGAGRRPLFLLLGVSSLELSGVSLSGGNGAGDDVA